MSDTVTEFLSDPENILWTPDCQGKWDYDASIVKVSSRYYPRGGGYHLLGPNGWEGNETRPDVAPSAASTILVLGRDWATCGFSAETEASVKAQVECWVKGQLIALLDKLGIAP